MNRVQRFMLGKKHKESGALGCGAQSLALCIGTTAARCSTWSDLSQISKGKGYRIKPHGQLVLVS